MWHLADMPILPPDVCFSNRPFGVKRFQTIHHHSVDVARGLVLLFGIGTKALPSWDSKTRRNNLLVGLAVNRTAGPSRHANSPHPSSREGHPSTARWISSFLLSGLIPNGFHVAATACSRVQRNSVPSWLRWKISYWAFEQAVRNAFESGMAWVFRKCRHLTPNTALLVIVVAVLGLPISFGAATAMHAVLFAKLTSWPAWMQLLHPLATVIAKSKLLVLPIYPAAWPQTKKNSFVQLVVKGYQNITRLYVIRKVGFRYRQAGTAGIVAVEKLKRTAVLASAGSWGVQGARRPTFLRGQDHLEKH